MNGEQNSKLVTTQCHILCNRDRTCFNEHVNAFEISGYMKYFQEVLTSWKERDYSADAYSYTMNRYHLH